MTTRNSDQVANFEATPPVINSAGLYQGVVRIAQGTMELLAGDSTDNDIVMLAAIPSNATITSIKIGSKTIYLYLLFNLVTLHCKTNDDLNQIKKVQ